MSSSIYLKWMKTGTFLSTESIILILAQSELFLIVAGFGLKS